jgi:hypothetical protein
MVVGVSGMDLGAKESGFGGSIGSQTAGSLFHLAQQELQVLGRWFPQNRRWPASGCRWRFRGNGAHNLIKDNGQDASPQVN